MKKFLNSFFGRLVILVLIISGIYSVFEEGAIYNKYKCATKEMELKGVIIFVTGRSGYGQVQIDNREKPFSLNVSKEIYRKGFGRYHFFDIGDSIIKSAGSKEVTVKKKDSVLIFILSCND